MKMNRSIITALIGAALISSCTKKPEDIPTPVEQELITTVRLIFTDSMNQKDSFSYKVFNGFNSPDISNFSVDTIRLHAGTTYQVSVSFLNEKENPAVDATEEVINENEEHLILFRSDPQSGIGALVFSNGNKDNAGKPFNQQGTITAGMAGKGTLSVWLIHQPTDKNGTTQNDSGGETDAFGSFPVLLQ